MAQGGSDYGTSHSLQSLHAAFRLIEELEDCGSAGVTELADQLSVPKSTAHVYLSTLAELGYVINDGGTYRVSLKFLERGGRVRQRQEIYGAAKSDLDNLAAVTDELATLGTVENGMRVLLAKSEGTDAVHDNVPIGEFTHMHWSSLGKAILAHLPEGRVEEIVERHGLPSATAHSVDTREALFEDLAVTRERGYALEDEERRLGMRAVAVPIIDDTDRVIASISVSGPKNRFGDERIEDDIARALESTANVIQLQYVHD